MPRQMIVSAIAGGIAAVLAGINLSASLAGIVKYVFCG